MTIYNQLRKDTVKEIKSDDAQVLEATHQLSSSGDGAVGDNVSSVVK